MLGYIWKASEREGCVNFAFARKNHKRVSHDVVIVVLSRPDFWSK